MGGRRPAVFLDRDGTLIRERDYLSNPDQVELIPGAVDALRRLREAGFALVVVTNQSGIARGLYSMEDYRSVEARLDRILADDGVVLDATRFCPHHPDFTGPCPCRKPATGMYLDAARELDLDVERSFYVGDKVSDLEPSLALGGQGILVRTGYGAESESAAPEGVWIAADIGEAARRILAEFGGSGGGPGGAAEA